MSKTIDIICVGEILIDLIGHQAEATISQTKDYHRYLGGSPANVAMNMARLGMNVVMAGTVGDDGFGHYAIDKIKKTGISDQCLRIDKMVPTSVIFVSKTSGTPDFIPFRKADKHITLKQLPTEVLAQSKIYHTTAFSLSKNPARKTILAKAKEAHKLGCTLSIDFNFSERIWESREKAARCLQEYCLYDPLVKISEDDMERFFGEVKSHKAIFNYFHHNLGASMVCLTLGSKGVTLSRKHKSPITMSAKKIEQIADATGAGDAFWSGFLFGYSKGLPIKRCMDTALSLAAIKLQNVGRLPRNIDLITKLSSIA